MKLRPDGLNLTHAKRPSTIRYHRAPTEIIWPMPRVAAATLALIAAGILPVGCGGASVAKSQALAYAHAINLRPGDLPGWTPTIHERVQRVPKREAGLARCLGLPFRAGRVTVVSAVLSRFDARPDGGQLEHVHVRVGAERHAVHPRVRRQRLRTWTDFLPRLGRRASLREAVPLALQTQRQLLSLLDSRARGRGL